MKLKRKKIGDRSYDLIDVATGKAVARASQTGEHGRDNYPWDWELADDISGFGDPGIRTTGHTESLKNAVDFIETAATDCGLIYHKSRDEKREEALAQAQEKPESALAAMVRKIDNKPKGHVGYVTNRDELIAILNEVTPLLTVAILETNTAFNKERGNKEVSVEIRLGLTLERKLL
jgi:hypothetical protein